MNAGGRDPKFYKVMTIYFDIRLKKLGWKQYPSLRNDISKVCQGIHAGRRDSVKVLQSNDSSTSIYDIFHSYIG